VHNSPLSEVGALAFEYGYSAAEPACLVIWEAQFGDFANNAQMVIDQFIVAAQAKWGQRSGWSSSSPTATRGRAPSIRAHGWSATSAGVERKHPGGQLLQLCPVFPPLRDQALAPLPRPLIVITPKSLLRASETSCAARI